MNIKFLYKFTPNKILSIGDTDRSSFATAPIELEDIELDFDFHPTKLRKIYERFKKQKEECALNILLIKTIRLDISVTEYRKLFSALDEIAAKFVKEQESPLIQALGIPIENDIIVYFTDNYGIGYRALDLCDRCIQIAKEASLASDAKVN
jgi:hypothetical protein